MEITHAEWAMATAAAEETPLRITVTSSTFRDGEAIPPKHTCDGADVSPQLMWSAPPPGTRSLALIVDDPDAPSKTWVHWVVYNIPPSVRALHESFPANSRLPDGTQQGMTDFGRSGYGGPCPPRGTHRYFFRVYALDTVLTLPSEQAAKAALEQAMAGHVLVQGTLMGTYRRKKH